MTVEWAWPKAALMFCGLVCKGLALGDVLPWEFGPGLKAVAGVVWPAFDGAFLWLLRPPSESARNMGGAAGASEV